MKRARNKKNTTPDLGKKSIKGYQSDMEELGYDPETFAENEDDVRARPDLTEVAEVADYGQAEEIIEAKPEETAEEEITGVEPEEIAEETSEHTDEPAEDMSDSVLYEGDENPDDFSPPKKHKKKLLIFSASLAAIILVFFAFLGFGGFFNHTASDGEIDQDYMVPVDKATGKINVLILGVDKDGLRTDTIVVACYDLDDNKINILSIPRDTRMYIGNKYQKINAAHAISQKGQIKGPQGSIEAVTRLTGIPINYYVEFSFDAFRNTIDALDGIYFDVPRDMNYEDPAQKLTIHLKKGYQLLDGDKAEQLVRFRRYPEGDIARVEMQQAFMKAVADQKLNMSIISKIPSLFEVLNKDINTNFTILDVTKYMNNLSELSSENIVMHQLPGKFSGSEYTTSYWLPNMDAIKQMVENDFEMNAASATIHSEDNTSIAKENADRQPTASPTAKPSQTVGTKSTQKAATVKPSASSKATSAPAHSPSATAKPSQTQEPVRETIKPTEKPVVETQKPETPKPTSTASPTKSTTPRPARPTPNVTEDSED